MIPLLPALHAETVAAYRQTGLKISDLLRQLVQAGLLGAGAQGAATHYSARPHWLQPFARRPAAAAATAPAPGRRLMPLSLPPKHAPPPPPAAAAGRGAGPAAPAADDVVEAALRRPAAWGKSTMSRSNGVKILADTLQELLEGEGARCRAVRAACEGCL